MGKQMMMTPPLTDEDTENKLIAMTIALVEKQLQEGTASSQIMKHFLDLATLKYKIQLEKIELENRLIEEKIAAEQQGQRLGEMFEEVMRALKSYSYAPPGEYDD